MSTLTEAAEFVRRIENEIESNDTDKRPLAKNDKSSPGMKAVLDENREVAGFKTESGFIFIFRSHGIDTQIALSTEALCAAVDIAAALTTEWKQ